MQKNYSAEMIFSSHDTFLITAPNLEPLSQIQYKLSFNLGALQNGA